VEINEKTGLNAVVLDSTDRSSRFLTSPERLVIDHLRIFWVEVVDDTAWSFFFLSKQHLGPID
jgi:hypothetical protein